MNNKQTTIIEKALKGDKDALEKVVIDIKDQVYNLSLKMLYFPEDAKDATQEILIRVITHLCTFRGESNFNTWVYRVATNYLLTEKLKREKGANNISFDDFAKQIDRGQSNTILYTKNAGEISLLEEEVKVSCIHGLLHCLNATNRLIYIIGDILEFNSMEASEILQITPESFRKQLSRSREKIRNHLTAKCGLVDPGNSCRCKRKIDFLIDSEVIQPTSLKFANHTKRSDEMIEKIENLDKSLQVFRSIPVMEAPGTIISKMRQIINSTTF